MIKFILIIVSLFLAFYYKTKKTVIKENFQSKFVSQPCPYSIKCMSKYLEQPDLYQYSTSDLSHVYSLTNKSSNLQTYYRTLSDALGNKNSNSIITSNKPNQTNDELPKSSTCKRPSSTIKIQNKNNQSILKEFKKIISISADVNLSSKIPNYIEQFENIPAEITNIAVDDDKNKYYYEFPNEYFNKYFNLLCSNDHINYNDFIEDNVDLEIYDKIESNMISAINSINELKLANSTDFEIMQRSINHYMIKKNSKEYYIDFDIVIYRKGKSYAKHLNINVLYNLLSINIISLNVIGIIIESDLDMNINALLPYDKNDEQDYMLINDDLGFNLIQTSEFEQQQIIQSHTSQIV